MNALIEPSLYYNDFLTYYKKAQLQQEQSNLGVIPHAQSGVSDSLMENVELYDVTERKYAGFGQILNDVYFGWSEDHPYWAKMDTGFHTKERKKVAKPWSGKRKIFKLEDWAYVFLVHRITGSAINYSKIPSGYFNTVLPALSQANSIDGMVEVIRAYKETKFTSIGYQYPQFPKAPEGYRIGGDYYLAEFAPKLAREFSAWLVKGRRKTFREMGEWALDWNTEHGLKRYKFQYAAWVADFGDFFPEFVECESPFYYGTNAIECISYLAKPTSKMKKEDFLDAVMMQIMEDTGALPYNAEDVACDYIRWVENYLKPGGQYDHIDRDKVWNSSVITDHPYGRQKKMLELGLIDSFNNLLVHPSDDYILKLNNMSVQDYKQRCLQPPIKRKVKSPQLPTFV